MRFASLVTVVGVAALSALGCGAAEEEQAESADNAVVSAKPVEKPSETSLLKTWQLDPHIQAASAARVSIRRDLAPDFVVVEVWKDDQPARAWKAEIVSEKTDACNIRTITAHTTGKPGDEPSSIDISVTDNSKISAACAKEQPFYGATVVQLRFVISGGTVHTSSTLVGPALTTETFQR